MIYVNLFNENCRLDAEMCRLHANKQRAIRHACEQHGSWFWQPARGYIKTQVFDRETFQFLFEVDLSDDIDALCDSFNEQDEYFSFDNFVNHKQPEVCHG